MLRIKDSREKNYTLSDYFIRFRLNLCNSKSSLLHLLNSWIVGILMDFLSQIFKKKTIIQKIEINNSIKIIVFDILY